MKTENLIYVRVNGGVPEVLFEKPEEAGFSSDSMAEVWHSVGIWRKEGQTCSLDMGLVTNPNYILGVFDRTDNTHILTMVTAIVKVATVFCFSRAEWLQKQTRELAQD